MNDMNEYRFGVLPSEDGESTHFAIKSRIRCEISGKCNPTVAINAHYHFSMKTKF